MTEEKKLTWEDLPEGFGDIIDTDLKTGNGRRWREGKIIEEDRDTIGEELDRDNARLNPDLDECPTCGHRAHQEGSCTFTEEEDGTDWECCCWRT